ncbi:MAG: lipoyl(octanoyl) transferase LipB [Proteobacteria bacterium]|nr:lipoyl(octanoyl) transferase LipB [Pseudomonadota bacterium]
MDKLNIIKLKTDYLTADEKQVQAVQDVIDGKNESLFLLELDDVYTAGTSSDIERDYLDKSIPLVKTGRGGQLTYHGPGQIVAYPIIDLSKREKDLKKYVKDLQAWIINTLKHFDIKAFTTDDVGVWVETDSGRKKIAAIGIRVRKWVTFHGIALNVDPDLSKFGGIIPCGISNFGVTSISEVLNKQVSNKDVEDVLVEEFKKIFY